MPNARLSGLGWAKTILGQQTKPDKKNHQLSLLSGPPSPLESKFDTAEIKAFSGMGYSIVSKLKPGNFSKWRLLRVINVNPFAMQLAAIQVSWISIGTLFLFISAHNLECILATGRSMVKVGIESKSASTKEDRFILFSGFLARLTPWSSSLAEITDRNNSSSSLPLTNFWKGKEV